MFDPVLRMFNLSKIMEGFWLVSTEHLEDRLWFKDDEDFKAGMNNVAILAARMPAQIMAFVLMSNHVHFVVGGDKDDACDFVSSFKKRYSQYYSGKYTLRGLLGKNKIDLRELSFSNESFERAIAYVQMNPVAANICIHPSGYPWGTGSSFYYTAQSKRKTIANLSQAESIRLLHSRQVLPPHYVVDERGFIDPVSYVNVDFVQSVFRSPNRMSYFLNASSKAKKETGVPSFSDKLISMALRELCISVFNKPDMVELSEGQMAELLKQLRYRFSMDPNQLARVCGVPYEKVTRLLDSF